MTQLVATRPTTASARIDLTGAPDRYVLAAEHDRGVERLVVDATPSLVTAKLFARSVRRIHLVRFCRHEGVWSATAEITGHRLPQCRSISVGTAVALALLGHEVGVCADTFETRGVDDGRLPL